jgi:hypothetical protein
MQKLYIILSNCDNVIENIQIHMPWQVFFFFSVWNFSKPWKINMKKINLVIFFFEKKIIRFVKN